MRLCIVRAYPAVIMRWRVLWLVAAVSIVMRSLTAPAAPESVAASFLSKRSEMKTVPKPMFSPKRTSSSRSRDDVACPANV